MKNKFLFLKIGLLMYRWWNWNFKKTVAVSHNGPFKKFRLSLLKEEKSSTFIISRSTLMMCTLGMSSKSAMANRVIFQNT